MGMAQPNVAREPSMEEILASIRRIIESNDPVTESEIVSGAQASSYDDGEEFEIESDYEDDGYLPQAPANDPGKARSEELEAERVKMTMESRNPAPMSPQPSEKTLSLADVAARVRAAASRVPEPVAQRPVAAQVAPQPAYSQAEPRFEKPAVEATRPVEQMREPVRAEPVSERPIPVAEMREAPVAHRSEALEPSADSLPARIEQASLLISDEAGAQIARSFNELATVVSSIEKQSVEDMAKEMLKPMLREWLDDNLPTLVERLVREEIERVARGPRR